MESMSAMSLSSWNTTETRGILSEISRPFNDIVVLLANPDQGEVVVEDVDAVHQDLLGVHNPRLVDIEAASNDDSQGITLLLETPDFHSKI